MKYIKKVSVSQLSSNTGTIIDSMNSADDPTTNAPSIHAVKEYVPNNTTNYSTTEAVVGTWIDGKPLYRITVSVGTMPNNSTKNVNHGVSNIDKIVKISGVSVGASNVLPLPYLLLSNYAYSIELYVSKTQVCIKTGNDRSSHTGYVTFEYTKTTDTV